MTNRIKNFQKQLLAEGVDFAFISKKSNILFLTGLKSLHPTEREAYLMVTPTETVLYHSPFIALSNETARQLIAIPMSAKRPLGEILKKYGDSAHDLGVEKLDLTIAELERIQNFLPGKSIIAVDNWLKSQRQIKDDDEIKNITKACQITSKLMKWAHNLILSNQSKDITEQELVHLIEDQAYKRGADGLAFPTIIAFDSHTASPHHTSDNTKLKKDSVVLIDMGFTVNGYMSDMTRTWSRSPTPLFNEIETIVKSAHRQALSTIPNYQNLTDTDTAHNQKAYPIVSQIDKAARDVITKAGYGETFIHTTGHGLGLETHESPSVNGNNPDQLMAGMVITIEPGIYLDGKFGYRHEDTILVS